MRIRLAFLTLFATLVECFSFRYFFMHSFFSAQKFLPVSGCTQKTSPGLSIDAVIPSRPLAVNSSVISPRFLRLARPRDRDKNYDFMFFTVRRSSTLVISPAFTRLSFAGSCRLCSATLSAAFFWAAATFCSLACFFCARFASIRDASACFGEMLWRLCSLLDPLSHSTSSEISHISHFVAAAHGFNTIFERFRAFGGACGAAKRSQSTPHPNFVPIEVFRFLQN